MKIKYPFLFLDEIVEAKLVEMHSPYSREETSMVLEIVDRYVQIEPPASDCIIISATPEEILSFKNAGYQLNSTML